LPIEITIPAEPSEADREAIMTPLIAYNEALAGPAKYEPLAILLRDSATGGSMGGLWGQIYFEWLFVELLFVADGARRGGIGSGLLARAEDIARSKGCVGVWLDTFSFQAPEFYRKHGYEVFGTLEDYPTGRQRFYLRKTLAPSSPPALRA